MNQLYANFAGAVPTLLIGGTVAFALAVRSLAVHSPRGAARAIAVYCVFAITVITLWSHGPSHERDLQLIPFDHLFALLRTPNSRIELGYSNIALYVPFGVFVPLAWEFARPLWRTVLLAAGLAVVLELAQFVVGGHETSVNDVILNSFGAVIGWLSWRLGLAIWRGAAARRRSSA